MWIYKAEIVRVVDADTLDFAVDLGFRMKLQVRCRLARVDAPEMSTQEGKAAKAALLAKTTTLQEDCTISTSKGDRYGRWIAEVVLSDGTNLSDWLLSSGLAKDYA